MDGRDFCLRTAHMVALRQECASWLNSRVSGEGEDLTKGSAGGFQFRELMATKTYGGIIGFYSVSL